MAGGRKTRVVCISDTHNQTPKLPRGDVLIHAGDLTNQGSYSELKKTVEWLERQDFEAKIVVAGNHDIALDGPFFRHNSQSWKWPSPQDAGMCRKLLTESTSITYLENAATQIRLTSGACFTVFGSPCTPKQGTWAFQYAGNQEAECVWSRIPDGVDVVVTHTPPKGHCDGTAEGLTDKREGCPSLLKRLSQVRPKLNICGHIHGGWGVETVRWRLTPDDVSGNLVEDVAFWNEPGASSKKLFLVDLTIKSRAGRSLGCDASLTRQRKPDSLQDGTRGQPDASLAPDDKTAHQPRSGGERLVSSGRLADAGLGNNEALWGGGQAHVSGVGHGRPDEATQGPDDRDERGTCSDTDGDGQGARTETTVVNAAYLGPRVGGRAVGYHKPIVVDMEFTVVGTRTNDQPPHLELDGLGS
ncbi:Metallophos multi-domain protein [Pyrenophora tritici-repentis]|uniref:Metallophos multi-domain protein n=1 Tax=Pyrenophora tritici-repentis TaxID=45151 RepID=A0A2W1E126_9PLEO|nr:Metallophos multi-domain protein [Pyrenophora tritici-repentis]KAF7576258.1 Metallophos multi-domain protein [Pyrenophora tritici-repentis]KAG9377345.1 Metallophos multi-domain protein [Pyrenophora tritici-repentis]KAI1534389.1 Metallophos multi-domain protein [Pyrenophora tritici-repentis]KAI1535531.1 Metallophos multi-domain protein [Pyrenophora tritici-repentis]